MSNETASLLLFIIIFSNLSTCICMLAIGVKREIQKAIILRKAVTGDAL